MDKKPAGQTTLRERQREQTRLHLLTVATELIGTGGFNATSIDDIAMAAGAGRATVYSYFATKHAILEEIIRGMWEDAEHMYRDFGDIAEWTRPAVRGWMMSVLHRWEGDQPRHHAVMAAGVGSQKELYEHYTNRYVDAVMLNQRLWQERFGEAEGRRRALMLISMLETYMHKVFTLDLESDRTQAVDSLTDVWLDVLHASS